MQNLQIELLALMAEMEGMKAANSERLSAGYSLAYDENSFMELADRIRELGRDGT